MMVALDREIVVLDVLPPTLSCLQTHRSTLVLKVYFLVGASYTRTLGYGYG